MWTRKVGITSLCLVLVTISTILLFPKSTFAASFETQGLTTTPVSTVLNTKPGSTATTVLQVQNTTPVATTITVKLDEFKADGSSGQATFITPPANDPSVAWVHFSTTSFTANPFQWVPVTMTINVPKNAALGYYYAVLFSRSSPIKKATNNYRSANAIFVLVNTNSSNEFKELQVSSFNTDKTVYNFLPVKFNVLINNPGNIFLSPQGEIYISRKSGGKIIDTIDVNKGGNDILPNSSRLFNAQWSDGLPVYSDKMVNGQVVTNKNGQPEKYINWSSQLSLSKFRFGKYYANLVMVYNDGTLEVPIQGQVSFWVIPWILILEIIAAIVIIIIIYRYIKKAIKKLWHKLHKKQKSQKPPQKTDILK